MLELVEINTCRKIRLVIEILKNKFGMNVSEPPLLVKYTPDQTALEKCFALGRRVPESLIHKA